MTTINPLSTPLEEALVASERMRHRVYQADDLFAPLPDLIQRARVSDQGGYVEKWWDNCSFRQEGMYGFRHYRFVFVDTDRDIPTTEMLHRANLHATFDQSSLFELIKFFIWHRKVAMRFMQQGHTFASIGQDRFRLSFGTYPELRLNESGAPVLNQVKLYPGVWSAHHILLVRATLA